MANFRELLITFRVIAFYLLMKKRAARRQLWSSEVFRLREIHGHGRMLREQLMDCPGKFFEYTRMSVPQFHQLLDMLSPKLTKKNTHLRKSISAYERLAICLRFLATGESYTTLSLGFRVGKSTVQAIIMETCKAIISTLKPKYLNMPNSTEEWVAISKGFEHKWNFPQCMGAIDGKHIAIQAPKNSGSTYINYKGFHSVVLMAACDAQYCFTFVHIGDYGRFSDGGIFKQSYLGKIISQNDSFPGNEKLPSSTKTVPYVFVADEAFPLQSHLLRPFPGSYLAKEKKIFNYRLSRARRCIENAFGILAARWRVLLTTMALTPDHASLVTMACCCLHNYLMKLQMPSADRTYCPFTFADRPDENGAVNEGSVQLEDSLISIEPLHDSEEEISGTDARNLFCEYFNNEGSVPWQDNI